MNLIPRKQLKDVLNSLSYFPVVAIIGPRQVGKTTLVKQLITEIQSDFLYLDLERTSDLNKLTDAELFLSQNRKKLVVIDEIQIRSDLYQLLRSLVDEDRRPGQFILLGSASPELIRDSSETLAGRIAYHRLYPLSLEEIPSQIVQNDLWIKGGFPNSLLAPSNELSQQWMENFIQTYLNRDLLQLGLNASTNTIRNLWSMMAHTCGQLLNTTTLANSLSISSPTVKRYLDFLEGAFLLKSLHSYSGNMKKRLVKTPKIYITDTGILHHFLGIDSFNELAGLASAGASWETFVVTQVLAAKNNSYSIYFYRTHHGAEVDLVITKGQKVHAAVEIKFTNSPKLSKGNYIAFEDLKARSNFVITPYSDDYLITESIRVCSLKTFILKYLPDL